MDDVAQLVHDTLVTQAAEMVDAGAPHEVVIGELIKLAIKASVALRGKKKGQRDIQDLVKHCFAAIGPEEEGRLRRGRPH
jgi:hypothetical protein